jgi:uncharacterized membrane-anchored protein YitT (DUF2179 family)
MNEVPPVESPTPTQRSIFQLAFLKKRRWRLVTLLLIVASSSVLSVFVIEAPMGYDAILSLPLMLLVFMPFIGLPLFLLSVWWILDKRLPLILPIIVFFSIAYCFRILIGSPPEMTDEWRKYEQDMNEEMFKDHPGMTEEERESNRIFREMSERNLKESRNPGYKRKIFPPF